MTETENNGETGQYYYLHSLLKTNKRNKNRRDMALQTFVWQNQRMQQSVIKINGKI